MDSSSTVKVAVACRVRPLNANELSNGDAAAVKTSPEGKTVTVGTSTNAKSFAFDHVFGSSSSTGQLYDECVAPLVATALQGFNVTVFAYGQTGSGKTWTMSSGFETPDTITSHSGIIPRLLKDLFSALEDSLAAGVGAGSSAAADAAAAAAVAAAGNGSVVSFKVSTSCLEIYNENTFDLLDSQSGAKSAKALVIRDNDKGDQVVTGLTEQPVASAKQAAEALARGLSARQTASTNMNERSSRSHCIFTLSVEQTLAMGGGVLSKRTSKIHLVDLAGSERASKTGASGARLQEGANINRGLLALGNCINALVAMQEDAVASASASSASSSAAASSSSSSSGPTTHVPYRDSKLTRLLKSSLGGSSHTLMIACASPADSSLEETTSTLRYSSRARAITNKATVNVDPLTQQLVELRKRVQDLETELVDARGGGGGGTGQGQALLASSSSSSAAITAAAAASASASAAAVAMMEEALMEKHAEVALLKERLSTTRKELVKQQRAYQDLTLAEMRSRGETRKLASYLKQLMLAVAAAPQAQDQDQDQVAQVLARIAADVEAASLLMTVTATAAASGRARRGSNVISLAGIAETVEEDDDGGEEDLEAEEAQLLSDLQGELMMTANAASGAGAGGQSSGHEGGDSYGEQNDEQEDDDEEGDEAFWASAVDISDLAMDAAVSALAKEMDVADENRNNATNNNACAAPGALTTAKSVASNPAVARKPLSSASAPSGHGQAAKVAAPLPLAVAKVQAPANKKAVPAQAQAQGQGQARNPAVRQQQQPPQQAQPQPSSLLLLHRHRDRLVELNMSLKAKEQELRSLQTAKNKAAAMSSSSSSSVAAVDLRTLQERVAALSSERDSLKKRLEELQQLQQKQQHAAQTSSSAASSKPQTAIAPAASASALNALRSQLEAKELELHRLKQEAMNSSNNTNSSNSAAADNTSNSSVSQMQALLQSQASKASKVAAEVTALRRERLATLRAIKEEATKTKRAKLEAQEHARRALVAENKAEKAQLEAEKAKQEGAQIKEAERRKQEEILRLKRSLQERERQRRAGTLLPTSNAAAGLLSSLSAAASPLLVELMGSVPAAAFSSFSNRSRCGPLAALAQQEGLSASSPNGLFASASLQGAQQWLGSVDHLAATRFLAVLSSAVAGSLVANKDVAFTTAVTRQVGKILPGAGEGLLPVTEPGYSAGALLRGAVVVGRGAAAAEQTGVYQQQQQSSEEGEEDGDAADADIVPSSKGPRVGQKRKAAATGMAAAALAMPTFSSSDSSSGAGDNGASTTTGGTLSVDPFDATEPRPTDSLVALADAFVGSAGHNELPLELRRKLEGFVAAKVGLRRAKTKLQELREARKAVCAQLQAAQQASASSPAAAAASAAQLRRRRDVYVREIAACNDAILHFSSALEELQQQAAPLAGQGSSRARKAHWLPQALLANGNDRRALTWLSNTVASMAATVDASLHELAVSRKCASAVFREAGVAVLAAAHDAAEAKKNAAKEVAELQGQVVFLLDQLSQSQHAAALSTGSSNRVANIERGLADKVRDAAALRATIAAEREAKLKAEKEAALSASHLSGLEEELSSLHEAIKLKSSSVAEALAVLGLQEGSLTAVAAAAPRGSLGGASTSSFGSKRSKGSSGSSASSASSKAASTAGGHVNAGRRGRASSGSGAAITKLPASAAALLLPGGHFAQPAGANGEEDGFAVTAEPAMSESESDDEDDGSSDDENEAGGRGNDRKRRRISTSDDEAEEEGESSDEGSSEEEDEDDESDESDEDYDDSDDNSDFGGRKKRGQQQKKRASPKKVAAKPAASRPAAKKAKAEPAVAPPSSAAAGTAASDPLARECFSCNCASKCVTNRCPCRAGGKDCLLGCKCKQRVCMNRPAPATTEAADSTTAAASVVQEAAALLPDLPALALADGNKPCSIAAMAMAAAAIKMEQVPAGVPAAPAPAASAVKDEKLAAKPALLPPPAPGAATAPVTAGPSAARLAFVPRPLAAAGPAPSARLAVPASASAPATATAPSSSVPAVMPSGSSIGGGASAPTKPASSSSSAVGSVRLPQAGGSAAAATATSATAGSLAGFKRPREEAASVAAAISSGGTTSSSSSSSAALPSRPAFGKLSTAASNKFTASTAVSGKPVVARPFGSSTSSVVMSRPPASSVVMASSSNRPLQPSSGAAAAAPTSLAATGGFNAGTQPGFGR